MTDKLTPEQEKIVEANKKHWIGVGLNCDPCNFEKAKECINMAYDAANEKRPETFYLYDSPASSAIAQAITDAFIFHDNKPNKPKKKYQQQTIDIYPKALEDCLRQLKELHGFVPTKAQLKEVAITNLDLDFYLNHQIYGSHDAPWLSFYDTWKKLGKEKEVEPLNGLIELAYHCGWWAAYDKTAFLQHRHAEIHMNSTNQLHKDLGPAVRYRDGYQMWYLNGVAMPQDIIMTPGEQLDCGLVAKTENVEQRREILRKIGAERYVHKVGAKVLDTEKNAKGETVYELIQIDIRNRNPARALKMLNPSLPEVWHIEFVRENANTVGEALMFRNGLTPDQIDDKNGADWWQQGDILLFPKGAKKFKSRPAKLT
jgi:hypothetical protein